MQPADSSLPAARRQACGCLALLCALLNACASVGPLPGRALHAPEDLLSAPGLNQLARVQPVPQEQILQISPAMQAFVERHVDSRAADGQRLQQLLKAMIDAGLLALEYRPGRTDTALGTFTSRQGNCLSFTNLFVALARAAGLEVSYQLVQVPPQWERDGQWVVRDSHINTVLHKLRIHGTFRRDYAVDFNIADFQGHYPRQEVADEVAFAHFYNNRAVELMQAGDQASALAHFAAAHALAPGFDALWTNLGTWHRLRDDHSRAESAYLRALALDPSNPAALSGLALLYHATGREERAARVEARLIGLREQDPYYFYQRSLAAMASGDRRGARKLIDQAIARHKQDHQFYFLRARLAWQQGDRQGASHDLKRALRLAPGERSRARYSAKLDALRERGES